MPPDRPPLDSVTIGTGDLPRSLAFYDAALGALGLVRVAELVDEEEDGAEVEAVGWGRADGPAAVWVVPSDTPTTGLHLRLAADSRLQVETFYANAIVSGGTSRQSPRPWTLYRPGEFGAMVADPQGNLIEAVCSE